ncbi:nucleotide exchange factor GrpE [Candidatus Uhrbacteria bacterium]|nr:nucleotide exchange factor GrpE [Candidatus Uhrbacteria bacterium]
MTEPLPAAEPVPADASDASSDVHAACPQQIAALEAKWKRAIADYQNRERDIAREREAFAKYCTADVIRDFLPLVDAIAASSTTEADPQSGTAGLYRLCLDILKRNGVEPIGVVGDQVDYLQHEVVATKSVEQQPAGVIVEVVQVGYVMNGKLLRSAKVVIAT